MLKYPEKYRMIIHIGVICIDRDGQSGYAFNTPFMACAIADQTSIRHVGIE